MVSSETTALKHADLGIIWDVLAHNNIGYRQSDRVVSDAFQKMKIRISVAILLKHISLKVQLY